jgi:hypothetical protein
MLLLVLLGLGAGAQANAKPPVTTPNNGCVVVPPLELAACLGRL